MTPAVYRMLLAERIQAMIADAEEDAEPLLAEAEDQLGLSLSSNPETAGTLLAELSDQLVGMAPTEPIQPIEFRVDPDTAEALEEDTLAEYLNLLLR
jgi:hypothetical protein